MNSGQLALLDEALQARDEGHPTHQAITDLIAADPLHAREREAVIDAMREAARRHGGVVDPNCVRALVPSWVGPRIVSAMYGVLHRKGVLEASAWTTNRDAKGRNNGKPLRTYRWVA